MTRICSLLSALVLLNVWSASAQPIDPHEEAEKLLEQYRAISIDPLRGMTQSEWDAAASEFVARIDSAKTATERFYAMRYFGALSRDGHFDFPDGGVFNRNKIFQKSDIVFPVMVRTTDDDRVFVVRDYTGSIPEFVELIEINRLSVSKLSHAQHLLTGSEPNYAYAWLNERDERDFREWSMFANYLFCERIEGPFTIKYVSEGQPKEVTIAGMKRGELHKLSKPERKGIRSMPLLGRVMEYRRHSDSTAVLDIDYFWGKNPLTFIFSETDNRFERILKRNMRRIDRDGITNLVIDLRSNAGGYAKNVYTLMSYLAPDMTFDDRQTYRVSEAARVDNRGARILESALKMTHGKNDLELQKRTVEVYRSMPDGTLFREDTLMTMAWRPAQKPSVHYRGRVWVLTNATTFSASVIFCDHFRKSGRGLIAGEAPGGYSQVTGGARIPIRSHLASFMPMYVPHAVSSPTGAVSYEYLVPDIPLENDFECWLRGGDNRLEALLYMVDKGMHMTSK